MSDYLSGENNNYYLKVFNENLKKLNINDEYTAEDITSIFLNSEKDENGNVTNDVFLDNLLEKYNMSHENVTPDIEYMLLSLNIPDKNQDSISETDLESAFGIAITEEQYGDWNPIELETQKEGVTQYAGTEEVYNETEIVPSEAETEIVASEAETGSIEPTTADSAPDTFNANDTDTTADSIPDTFNAYDTDTTIDSSDYEVKEGKSLTDEEKTNASFLKNSKVKVNENNEYYVDVEKYTGDHSRNGCVWDIVYNSYDLTGLNVSWDTLKAAIYKANGGEKRLHPGDKVILPPLSDIIAGTVKSPDEAAQSSVTTPAAATPAAATPAATSTSATPPGAVSNPADPSGSVDNSDPATNNTNVNTMEPSGNLDLKGKITSPEGNAYVNMYNNITDKSNPDEVKTYIGTVIDDENVSISDKMKILNMIYNDRDVDNSTTLKSYFSESDKFYTDVLNEIANNRDVYTYGDLVAFIGNYSLYNNNTVLDDDGNIKYAQFENKEEYVSAWVNVLQTAQNQEEVDKIINRVHRDADEKGMLTLTEAIYAYTENPSELASVVLTKESEAYKNKTDYSEFNIEENRAKDLIDNYSSGLNGVLEAIVDSKDDIITNNELLYVVQNFCGGDINNLVEQLNGLDTEVQKAVYVVLQEAYKNTGNAFDSLEKVSRNDSQNIANGYADTISAFMNSEELPGSKDSGDTEITENDDAPHLSEPAEYLLDSYGELLANKNNYSDNEYKEQVKSIISDIKANENISSTEKLMLLESIQQNDSDMVKNAFYTEKLYSDFLNSALTEFYNNGNSVSDIVDFCTRFSDMIGVDLSQNYTKDNIENIINIFDKAETPKDLAVLTSYFDTNTMIDKLRSSFNFRYYDNVNAPQYLNEEGTNLLRKLFNSINKYSTSTNNLDYGIPDNLVNNPAEKYKTKFEIIDAYNNGDISRNEAQYLLMNISGGSMDKLLGINNNNFFVNSQTIDFVKELAQFFTS